MSPTELTALCGSTLLRHISLISGVTTAQQKSALPDRRPAISTIAFALPSRPRQQYGVPLISRLVRIIDVLYVPEGVGYSDRTSKTFLRIVTAK